MKMQTGATNAMTDTPGNLRERLEAIVKRWNNSYQAQDLVRQLKELLAASPVAVGGATNRTLGAVLACVRECRKNGDWKEFDELTALMETQPPALVKEGEPEESGWLIEREGPTWACIKATPYIHFEWTNDSLKAFRFARKEDGEQVKPLMQDWQKLKVTEHVWPLAKPVASEGDHKLACGHMASEQWGDDGGTPHCGKCEPMAASEGKE